MSNGYNPYNIVGTQQGLLENLLGAEQAQRKGQLGTGEQKEKMKREFQSEQQASQEEQERILQKKRKKTGLGGFLEMALPLASMFIPGMPILTAALGGLGGMYGQSKEAKHAQSQIRKARKAGLDTGKWGGTFLGKEAAGITGETKSMLDEMLRGTKLSTGDLLKTGIESGMKSYAMGKVGEGIGKSFKKLKSGDLAKGSDIRAIKKSGLDKLSLTDAEGLSIDPKYGNLSEVDFSKMSHEDLNKIRGLGEKLGIERPVGVDTTGFTKEADWANIADPQTQFLTDTLNKAFGMRGKESLLGSMFGEGGFGMDPTDLLGEGSTGGNILQNLLMMQSLLGGRR